MDFLTPKVRGGHPVSYNRYRIMNVHQFVGMKIEEAKIAAHEAGFTTIKIESLGLQPLNNDHNTGRINFKVTDGIVTAANVG